MNGFYTFIDSGWIKFKKWIFSFQSQGTKSEWSKDQKDG